MAQINDSLGRTSFPEPTVTGTTMAECDDTIIRQHAKKLASRAASIALFYTVGSAIVFALLSYIAGMTLEQYRAADNYPLLFLGLVAGGFGGFWVGTDKAISLRLQAKIALCQLEIEGNF